MNAKDVSPKPRWAQADCRTNQHGNRPAPQHIFVRKSHHSPRPPHSLRARFPFVALSPRNKILQAYLPAVNPIVAPRLENNRLSFENAAVAADVAKAPALYRASWFHFDNATGESRPLSETTSATTAMEAPQGLPSVTNSFILVEVSADSKEHQAWQRPIRTYFRLDADGWKLVGLERLPDGPAHVAVERRAAR